MQSRHFGQGHPGGGQSPFAFRQIDPGTVDHAAAQGTYFRIFLHVIKDRTQVVRSKQGIRIEDQRRIGFQPVEYLVVGGAKSRIVRVGDYPYRGKMCFYPVCAVIGRGIVHHPDRPFQTLHRSNGRF